MLHMKLHYCKGKAEPRTSTVLSASATARSAALSRPPRAAVATRGGSSSSHVVLWLSSARVVPPARSLARNHVTVALGEQRHLLDAKSFAHPLV